MGRMQKPNPRQRQPVNVGLLDLSLENLRKQLTLNMANGAIELMTEWHTKFVAPSLDELSAHLLWHATPWYRKLWLRWKDLFRKEEEDVAKESDAEPDA